MRRAMCLLLSVAVLPAAVALPAFPALSAEPAPHPVAPHVVSIAIKAGGTGPRPATATELLTPAQETAGFSAFGASWDAGTDDGGTVEVRARAETTKVWSAWTTLDAADGGPDPGSADAVSAGRRVASEPVWAGPSDAVQTRVLAAPGDAVRLPVHLTVELVDPGTSAADAAVGAAVGGAAPSAAEAQAASGQPLILTRAQWGADESIRRNACPAGPAYSPTIKVGVVHHTVSTNSYSPDEVPALIRSFYAYHVQGNGWCDLGYNFLVDRFGRLWEGRFGGIDKAVIGSHTGGFNKESFGVSMIGDFSDLTPDAPMQQSIAALMAWKLGSYDRNPLGKATLTYAGGHYRFCGARECPVGSAVTLDVITGHRDADVGHTACPGDAGEAILPALRKGTAAALGGGLVVPSISTTDHRIGDGGAFTITAGVVTAQRWTLTATAASGQVVRTITGSAQAGGQISASWDGLTDAGVAAAPGTYTLTLSSSSSSGAAGPAASYAVAVTLHAPIELTGPAQVGYATTETLTGSTYAGAVVTMLQAPAGSALFTPVATVTADASGAFTWAYTGTSALATYAQTATFVSQTVTVVVGPSITGPAAAVPGSLVTLTGTAPPGSDVQVFIATAVQAGLLIATLTAGTDGSWTATYTADQTYSWYAVAAGLQSPTGSTSTSAPPALSGPEQVPLNGVVTLTGKAPAGEQVQIWRRQRGQAAYSLSATVLSGPTGTFAWAYSAGDDFRWYATTLGGRSATGLTQVGVTAGGPARVKRGTVTRLRGTTLPGAGVQIWHAAAGGQFVRGGTVVARADGTWSWPLTVDTGWRWYAVSRGWRSAEETTLVTSPPLVSGPAVASYATRVHVTGRARPGDTVTLWLHRRGSKGYRRAANAVTGRDGRWSMSYVANEDYRWYVASPAGRSRTVTTVVPTLAAAVPTARRGATVVLHGTAEGRQVVHVWFRTSGHWRLGRTLRANAAGRWRTTFVLARTTGWYATSRGRRSGTGTTRPR